VIPFGCGGICAPSACYYWHIIILLSWFGFLGFAPTTRRHKNRCFGAVG
jgi:hypothetical protein